MKTLELIKIKSYLQARREIRKEKNSIGSKFMLEQLDEMIDALDRELKLKEELTSEQRNNAFKEFAQSIIKELREKNNE